MKHLTSRVVPLNVDEIDTDQIIPARFLKSTNKEGFGYNLMRDWRYNSNGEINNSFVLNNSKFSGKVLLAGENFGCGSSREHAAWAIADYGFKVVLAKSFADIFKNNALNNGILPVTIPHSIVDQLDLIVNNHPESIVEIDLEASTLTIPALEYQQKIEISEYKRQCLINDYDDIDYLLSNMESIKEFEKNLIYS